MSPWVAVEDPGRDSRLKGTALDSSAAASVLLSYCTLRAKARDRGTGFTFIVPDETMHMLVDASERAIPRMSSLSLNNVMQAIGHMHVWDGNTDVGARLRGEVERQLVGTLALHDQPSAAVGQLTGWKQAFGDGMDQVMSPELQKQMSGAIAHVAPRMTKHHVAGGLRTIISPL